MGRCQWRKRKAESFLVIPPLPSILHNTTAFWSQDYSIPLKSYILKADDLKKKCDGKRSRDKEMKTKYITRTAILLALTILFQLFGRLIPIAQVNQFVVGPLVNACLLVAAAYAGLGGGTVVAVLSPFGAILTGAAMPLPIAPVVAAGNFVFVLLYFLLKKKPVLGVGLGAVLKFLLLWGGVSLLIHLMDFPADKAAVLIAAFSWPQLVTALVGGTIGLAVIRVLVKAQNTLPED